MKRFLLIPLARLLKLQNRVLHQFHDIAQRDGIELELAIISSSNHM